MKVFSLLFVFLIFFTYLCSMKDKRREVVIEIINKELEKHGKTFSDVWGKDYWFNEHTMTTKEWEVWKDFSINLMRTRLRFSKKVAEKEFAWLNLMWGLKIDEEEREDKGV
jgi:hypothetical protein